MSRPIVEEIQTVEQVSTCRHHWLIETPRGATSKGRCKRCGAEREFRNSATDYVWEDDSSRGYNPWSGIRSTPRIIDSDDDDVAAAPPTGGEPALAV